MLETCWWQSVEGPEKQGGVGSRLMPVSNKRPSVSPGDDLETFVRLGFICRMA